MDTPSAIEDGLPSRHLENLSALVELLPTKPVSSRIMKAEALRELGRFKEARVLLRQEVLFWHRFPKGLREMAQFIDTMCIEESRTVAEFLP